MTESGDSARRTPPPARGSRSLGLPGGPEAPLGVARSSRPSRSLVDRLTGAGDVTLFVLAAISLIPLAWLIGESTEHAAEHTGPGIGGFLNASFGNAPELIVALFAVGANLPDVVRGSLAGSVISNLLLVYGVTQIAGPDGARLDRRSLLVQLGLVRRRRRRVRSFPAALGYTGAPERHARRRRLGAGRDRAARCSISPSSAATCAATGSATASATSRPRARGRCRPRSPLSPWRPARPPG